MQKNIHAGVKICLVKDLPGYDIFNDCDCTFISPFVTNTLVLNAGETEYDGLVVTSKRSLEALCNCIYLNEIADQILWRKKKLFVVGPATKARAIELGFTKILGSESGSAIALVDYIIKEKISKLLVLVGDKNREELPLALAANGIEFDIQKVYETIPNPNLQMELLQLKDPEWIVFFSPSGFDAVNAFLKEFPKIACIGETTAAHITKLGYSVRAIASKPEQISLFNAMFKI